MRRPIARLLPSPGVHKVALAYPLLGSEAHKASSDVNGQR